MQISLSINAYSVWLLLWVLNMLKPFHILLHDKSPAVVPLCTRAYTLYTHTPCTTPHTIYYIHTYILSLSSYVSKTHQYLLLYVIKQSHIYYLILFISVVCPCIKGYNSRPLSRSLSQCVFAYTIYLLIIKINKINNSF